ncbi:unnamed protein product [Medioppia subpectinata]|uniref:SYO1-like TPR repeats domain-containing protein n=1 Tax=Medioppia subpectinata TaxID=1979941 RepID=A0A7R9KBL1_9ACAR|nr:unnamed protein product [Medioppia subpectinata]CAG2100409.1 unnamed protein product [Medioppia subpectinata]
MCLDRVENCRNAAIDCLCHLSSLSDKLCDLMVTADVMTPIVAAFNQYFVAANWLTPAGKHQPSPLVPQIYINLCRLLTNLCGTSDKALNVFNTSNVTQILVNGLNVGDTNIEVAIASAQCLSVVGEENQIPALLVPENLDVIKSLLIKLPENSSQMHLSLLTAFIGHNMGIGSDSKALEFTFALIDNALSAQCLPQIVDFAQNIQQGLVAKIGEHLCPLDSQLKDKLLLHGFGAEIVNCIESIQLCSLTCVHNLVACISPQTLSIGDQLWKNIYHMVFDGSTGGQPLVEEATNTIRALIARHPTLTLTGDELDRLCAHCQTVAAAAPGVGSITVKINVINVLSVCGQRSPDPAFVERVAALLLTGVESERDLTVRAELFDALIDVFSEDQKTDSIAVKLELIKRMKAAAVLFRKEANKAPECKSSAIISTVKLNLMPFIKYKHKMLNKK